MPRCFAILMMSLSSLTVVADPIVPIKVWEGTPPAETLTPKSGADPAGVMNDKNRRTDVFAPEFLPFPSAKTNSPIILVLPGGGFNFLADDHEGVAVAQRLNALGCSAIVLRYRVPRRSDDKPWEVPMIDARKTLEIIRARAAEWNGDPKKVGVLGFSAGGNLAVRLAYAPAAGEVPRPDFAIMVYPAYLLEDEKSGDVLRADIIPPKGVASLPAAFFAHSADDQWPAEASMKLAGVLKSLGGTAEVHVWANGGHGWGATDRCEAAKRWTELLGYWMKERGLLTSAP